MSQQQPYTEGTNVTGIESSPERCKAMLTGSEEFPPSSDCTVEDIAEARAVYVRESDPMNAMPAVEAGTTASDELLLLLDKLGGRLAFERIGVRAYDTLLMKVSAWDSVAYDIDPSELETIRQQEHEHYLMLFAMIEQLGGDPTAITPSGNVEATISKGVGAVLNDPRTTTAQCLEAMLVAELADNEGWDALIELARVQGEDALIPQLETARQQEQEHLVHLRRWVAACQGRSEDSTPQH